ncbi:MAG TPA: very short patch repair endonuclease [Methylobacter sp.]
MDKLTPEQRSKNMAAVKGKDTTPEIRVRRMLHKMGYRFRLHRKDLSGKPDIVLPRYRLCIFVHGCFWHQHPGCKRATIPEFNHEFWITKFQGTLKRDRQAKKELRHQGWRVCIIWECETKKEESLDRVIHRYMDRYV